MADKELNKEEIDAFKKELAEVKADMMRKELEDIKKERMRKELDELKKERAVPQKPVYVQVPAPTALSLPNLAFAALMLLIAGYLIGTVYGNGRRRQHQQLYQRVFASHRRRFDRSRHRRSACRAGDRDDNNSKEMSRYQPCHW